MLSIFFISNKVPQGRQIQTCLHHLSELGYKMYWLSQGSNANLSINSLQYIDILHPYKFWRQSYIIQLLANYKPDLVIFYDPFPKLSLLLLNLLKELNFPYQLWTKEQGLSQFYSSLFPKVLYINHLPKARYEPHTIYDKDCNIQFKHKDYYIIPLEKITTTEDIQNILTTFFQLKNFDTKILCTHLEEKAPLAQKKQFSRYFINSGLERNFQFIEEIPFSQLQSIYQNSNGLFPGLTVSADSTTFDIFKFLDASPEQLLASQEKFWNSLTRSFF